MDFPGERAMSERPMRAERAGMRLNEGEEREEGRAWCRGREGEEEEDEATTSSGCWVSKEWCGYGYACGEDGREEGVRRSARRGGRTSGPSRCDGRASGLSRRTRPCG